MKSISSSTEKTTQYYLLFQLISHIIFLIFSEIVQFLVNIRMPQIDWEHHTQRGVLKITDTRLTEKAKNKQIKT